MIFTLVWLTYLALATVIWFVATYKVSFYTHSMADTARAEAKEEAKSEWSSEKYQNSAAKWKMRRWYLSWYLVPFILAFAWMFVFPFVAGRKKAMDEKRFRANAEEAAQILEEWRERENRRTLAEAAANPLTIHDEETLALIRSAPNYAKVTNKRAG